MSKLHYGGCGTRGCTCKGMYSSDRDVWYLSSYDNNSDVVTFIELTARIAAMWVLIRRDRKEPL